MKVINVVQRPKLKRDYKGKKIRTTEDMGNGLGHISKGAIGTIETQSPKGSSIAFERCACCGLQLRISHVHSSCFEFIEVSDG